MNKTRMEVIDSRSVRRNKQGTTFEISVVPAVAPHPRVQHHVLTVEADCAKRRYRPVSIEAREADGRTVGRKSQESDAWAITPAGSAIDEAVTIACTGKPGRQQSLPMPSLERAVLAYRQLLSTNQLP
jgi:hypothetical protein